MMLVTSALLFVTVCPAVITNRIQDVLQQLRFRVVFADNYSFSGLCFVLNLQLSKSPPFILFLTLFSSNTRFNLPINILHSLQTRPVRLLSIIQRIF